MIPFIDLKAQMSRIETRVRARMDAVLAHGQFINGPEVRELEDALAERTGCPHVIGVSSGTDAILAAMMAAGIGPGDAVFLPAFTFTATPEAVLMCGATPVFVDVDGTSCNLDPEHLQTCIETVVAQGALMPRAVLAVDLFGLPANYNAIESVTSAHDMLIVADAAQSFGARQDDAAVGVLAPVTTTSFFPAKPLGCFGDGGAVLTTDGELAEALRSIRAHGKGAGKYDIVRVGLNGRLDTLQAAVLLAKLEVFDDELIARERVARHYDARLSGLVQLPGRNNGSQSAWAQYTIQTEGRDELATALKANGVPTAIYYPVPMHLQSAYQAYGDGQGSVPVAESLCSRVLSLPMHPYLDDATIDQVCDAVESTLKAGT
ncbi:MAG: DegT/DnrJ/EryC1/StrS family aminotransferase [Chromatiales bacterium]|jgi:UDP-2-acetamido-2-deoxy-ribo-hexuluronate aminotransferase|nr:DegT/DnrJ/EryC1/StrS family aminotransferase [Chromatiales bacterium]